MNFEKKANVFSVLVALEVISGIDVELGDASILAFRFGQRMATSVFHILAISANIWRELRAGM